MNKASRRVLLGSALALPFIARASAQPAWPDRPVRIIIPFGAGGPIDLVGRLLAEHLKERLGQPFIIENRPGAGGSIGIHTVVQSPPDGTAFLLTSASLASVPALYPNRGLDPRTALAPVSLVADIPTAMVVRAAPPPPKPYDADTLGGAQELDKMREAIGRMEARQYRTASEDRLMDIYRTRLSADPSKWRTGMGASYQVAGGARMQTNRGFRVMAMDRAGKRLLLRQVADTGLTSTGGDSDRMEDLWVYMGEAKRDRAHDAAELGPATPKAAPAPGAPGTIHRAFTADFTSEIHYARDKQGRVWRRAQFRDPRYGYKWSNWKFTKREAIPPGATPTDRRARLPD
jgi:hypothetical protein